MVMVPEKTLEHWCSQYILYRYRSRASLWWPTTGEDIRVGDFPARPGKVVQLEVKSWKSGSSHGVPFHDVKVNLGQLWAYLQLPLQPFYVIPRPYWPDPDLSSFANRHRQPVTDLAFSRSGPGVWFADWLIVLTSQQVANVLAAPLAAHGCAKRQGAEKTLVRFSIRGGGVVEQWGWSRHWTPGGTPRYAQWRDFWTLLESCGDSDWSQFIKLPRRLVSSGGLRHGDLARLLVEAREDQQRVLEDDEYVLVGQGEDGWRVTGNEDGGQTDGETSADNRQAVFLDASALSM